MQSIDVAHRERANRFVVRLGSKLAYLSYDRVRDGVLDYAHVYVPEDHRGQGIAAELARTAFEYARSEGIAVIPSCPYLTTYLKRHPEYEELAIEE